MITVYWLLYIFFVLIYRYTYMLSDIYGFWIVKFLSYNWHQWLKIEVRFSQHSLKRYNILYDLYNTLSGTTLNTTYIIHMHICVKTSGKATLYFLLSHFLAEELEAKRGQMTCQSYTATWLEIVIPRVGI